MRRARLERFLLGAQRPDGGWNCVEGAAHSSFNTTTAVLEALLPRSRSRQVAQALARGREFLRFHGMTQDELGIWTSPGGAKVAWFKDPDGNVLSVTERQCGASPQTEPLPGTARSMRDGPQAPSA
jgi:hypothetical protein